MSDFTYLDQNFEQETELDTETSEFMQLLIKNEEERDRRHNEYCAKICTMQSDKNYQWNQLIDILIICDLINLIKLVKINHNEYDISKDEEYLGKVLFNDNKLCFIDEKVGDSFTKILCKLNDYSPDDYSSDEYINSIASHVLDKILPPEDPDTPPHYRRGSCSNSHQPDDDIYEIFHVIFHEIYNNKFPQLKHDNEKKSAKITQWRKIDKKLKKTDEKYNYLSDRYNPSMIWGKYISIEFNFNVKSHIRILNMITLEMEKKVTFWSERYECYVFTLIKELYEDHLLNNLSKYTDLSVL